MDPMEKPPYVPTEIHVGTVTGRSGIFGILSIQSTEGRLDVALDRQAAGAIVNAINTLLTLASNES
jgi:hypothetical protein